MESYENVKREILRPTYWNLCKIFILRLKVKIGSMLKLSEVK